MGLIKEFKDFAMKGNMLDMAVGIIIGGAFGTVIKSLVEDVIMPPIAKLTGGVDFTNKFVSLDGETYATLAAAKEKAAPVIGYGSFITNLFSFLIIAFAVFILVKAVNTARKALEDEPEAAPAEPSEEILLLRDIRDSLKK